MHGDATAGQTSKPLATRKTITVASSAFAPCHGTLDRPSIGLTTNDAYRSRRTDIEPITDMRFIRVEDKDSIRQRYNAEIREHAKGSKVEEVNFAVRDMMDPYRLGELRLNNESEYNAKLLGAARAAAAAKADL